MSAIIIAGQGRIPAWVDDLKSFRRWAKSTDYPRRGWFSFLNGDLWVDPSMEQLITHNRVKTCYTVTLGGLVQNEERGYFFTDRALLTNVKANLSTEPDGIFVAYESIENGLVKLVKGADEGFTELEGSPDMTLEIVSRYSLRKDTEILPELYWKAGIQEYWLVDVRKEPIRFDIFRHAAGGYVPTRPRDGWVKSRVFDRAFALDTSKDRLGNAQYSLRIRK